MQVSLAAIGNDEAIVCRRRAVDLSKSINFFMGLSVHDHACHYLLYDRDLEIQLLLMALDDIPCLGGLLGLGGAVWRQKSTVDMIIL